MKRPTYSDPRANRGSWGSIFFVITVFLGLVAFLLLAPIGRIGIAILVCGVVFPAVIALHYFVWGRWLRRVLEQSGMDIDDDDDA